MRMALPCFPTLAVLVPIGSTKAWLVAAQQRPSVIQLFFVTPAASNRCDRARMQSNRERIRELIPIAIQSSPSTVRINSAPAENPISHRKGRQQ
jgi:hypothetical protein